MNELEMLVDQDTYRSFIEITSANSTTPEKVLSDFIKDYVVSSGHPEKVINRWPWNKQKKGAPDGNI